ncbi:unnamed protein product [Heligmosomoides polygyrus]|uniref:DUF3362 domain-containing protein n=1 Tax=Heligmosomoides polygyrus TaxID=6339 RepID=A0A183GQI9_HELPZ|nr:unnamed protein product [Heligmosomoides polygyrus]
METKMLRWNAGVTRMDRDRNDAIRQKFGVTPIADKMREARFRPRSAWKKSQRSGKVASRHQKSEPRNEAGQTMKKKQKKIVGIADNNA